MNAKTLVLNQDYTPITVCTLARAFVLVYLKKVELISPYDYFKINTVSESYDAPAVIRILKYANIPYKGVALTRQNVFKRDSFECQYCGTKKHLTLDHMIPRARGGATKWNNLITACKSCNTRKGDRLPEEAGLHLNQKPYRPNYIIFLRDFSGYTCSEWEPFLREKRIAV